MTDVIDEEKPALLVDLEKAIDDQILEKVTIVVPVTGSASNLIPLLLEPESSWSIVTSRGAGEHRFAEYLAEGKPYPVKRLPSIGELDLQVLED